MNVAVPWLAGAVIRAVLSIILVALSGSVASSQPSTSSAHSSLTYDYDAHSALVPPLGDAVSADASHPALVLGSTWKEVPASVRLFVQDELRSPLNLTDVAGTLGTAHSGAEAPRSPSSDFVAPGSTVSVFHGSIDNAGTIAANGLDVGRTPTWASRDLDAATNAIGPKRLEYPGRDPGIIESQIPKAEFDAVLGGSERPYGGWFGSNLDSTEIVLRTPEQVELFNRYMTGRIQ